MSNLASLKLVGAKAASTASPQTLRRSKVLRQLDEQVLMAQAMLRGETHSSTRTVVVRNKQTGESTTVTRVKRLKQWWFTSDAGKLCVQLRYGNRVLEFSKGKNAVELGSQRDLIPVLETLRSAVASGELDTQIESGSAAVRARFTK